MISEIVRQEAVYTATQSIPKGKVSTYGNIARVTGKRVHPRTVGAILGNNHDARVPCHRVVASDGSTGGYNKGISEKIIPASGLHEKETIDIRPASKEINIPQDARTSQ